MNNTSKQIEMIAYQQGKYKLNETSINRILKHGENGMIIISANRSSIYSENEQNSLQKDFEKWCDKEKVDYTDVSQQKFWLKERNKQAEADLKQSLKKSPFAYSSVYGGYHGTDSVVDEFEPSYIVYCHGKNYSSDYEPFDKLYAFALELCRKYKQDSVYIQPPHEAPYYVNCEGQKVSGKSSLNFKVNDNGQEFFTTSKRKKENPHKFTADIQFENMFRGSGPSTYFDRMKRRQSGEIFLDD